MKISKTNKVSMALLLSFSLSHIPDVALADTLAREKSGMISAAAVLTEISRGQAEREIQDYLDESEIRGELVKQGLSPDEVSLRLASLSDQEIRQLSIQVQEARAGGDILVAILLVILIIYFARRI